MTIDLNCPACKEILGELGKYGLLSPLLGQDGAGLVLSVWVVGQFWRAGGDWTLKYGLLQVVEHCTIFFGEEGHGHTALTRTTRTTDTMDVI